MMRRTDTVDLLMPFVLVGVISYLALRLSYESLPPFQWFVALPIGALAILEVMVSRRVRNAVRHKAGARPMTALSVARAVALGKASALVGAGAAGAAVALVLTVLPDAKRTTSAAHDLRVGVVIALATVVLTTAGLILERSGIDPNRDRQLPPD
jgi:hypothetical protein